MNALSSVKNDAGIYYISPMCVGRSPAPSRIGYTLDMLTGALLASLDLDLAPFAIFDMGCLYPCRRWTAKCSGEVIDWLKTTRESPQHFTVGGPLKAHTLGINFRAKSYGNSCVYEFGRFYLLVIEGVD